MPLCIPRYEEVEKYLPKEDILVRKRICTILSERDLFGDRVRVGGPAVVDYSVNMRTTTGIRIAYIKLGNVPLGWFRSTPQQGIYIEKVPLPQPFEWIENWPPLEDLVDCDIPSKIEQEFGIDISQYLS